MSEKETKTEKSNGEIESGKTRCVGDITMADGEREVYKRTDETVRVDDMIGSRN